MSFSLMKKAAVCVCCAGMLTLVWSVAVRAADNDDSMLEESRVDVLDVLQRDHDAIMSGNGEGAGAFRRSSAVLRRPNDATRSPNDARLMPNDARKRPNDATVYPNDARLHPNDARIHPNDAMENPNQDVLLAP